MTYAEYRWRCFGYYRSLDLEWLKVRKIAYNALIAPHQDPKRIPKTEKKFLPLNIDGIDGNKKPLVSKAAIERFKQEMEAYQRSVKKVKNG